MPLARAGLLSRCVRCVENPRPPARSQITLSHGGRRGDGPGARETETSYELLYIESGRADGAGPTQNATRRGRCRTSAGGMWKTWIFGDKYMTCFHSARGTSAQRQRAHARPSARAHPNGQIPNTVAQKRGRVGGVKRISICHARHAPHTPATRSLSARRWSCCPS